ncbi:hypothetical protein HMPREF0083_00807 [Aneurinibacillus aneurinilyticus ATCC 12856]|uniref:Uncharacterized protein n=1 Tax=Aneurinibacillus aneurinilyticus ATCC 12856 TaxID=649747 RepID=U1WR55_ANEAE|nr:hypothetical protein HMPREF0083_00807 [Aneurinibacillus aneurinilyticus ATCC 12856]
MVPSLAFSLVLILSHFTFTLQKNGDCARNVNLRAYKFVVCDSHTILLISFQRILFKYCREICSAVYKVQTPDCPFG